MGLDNDDIKQLIAILQRGLTNGDNEPVENITKKKQPKTRKETQKKIDQPKRQNKFDMMPERAMHKDDVLIDQKLIKSPPTPRREAFIPLKMVCRVCGKTEHVDPSMIESPDRFKCNKCAISAG